MKVKELLDLLKKANPEDEVLVADNGSIYDTAAVAENVEYNDGNNSGEYYIVTQEW